MPSFDIGDMIWRYILSKRITKSELGRRIGRKNGEVNTLLNRNSMQVYIVAEICDGLKHNFFADMAARIDPSYSISYPDKDERLLRIAALEKENETLRTEKAVLLEALRKG